MCFTDKNIRLIFIGVEQRVPKADGWRITQLLEMLVFGYLTWRFAVGCKKMSGKTKSGYFIDIMFAKINNDRERQNQS